MIKSHLIIKRTFYSRDFIILQPYKYNKEMPYLYSNS